MRGIGEVARASGLSVSALRFYDGARVLVPAEVDPATGYRRYADDQVRAARLIAGLRRVGMPVAEIAQAVCELGDPDSVRRRLDRHRRRLEDGLAGAKRELLRIHALLDLEEDLMTRISLPAAALAAALDAVRFAAPADAAGPIPRGVHAEAEGTTLTLVATDRFRLAVASAVAAIEGPPARLFLPLTFVDQLRAVRAGQVTLDLTTGSARAETKDGVVEAEPLPFDFPDFRRLLPTGDQQKRFTIDTAALREAVAAAPVTTREHEGTAYEISVLGLGPAGSVRLVAESEWAADAASHVAVRREFLLEALDAGAAGQLVLELDGPIKPLAFRVPGDDSRFSILMPVRH
ncbi:MAG TPA: MerR family transcriptional regulator [Actinoplanes sp.]|jgi:DNA polymerase-3 subunit beta